MVVHLTVADHHMVANHMADNHMADNHMVDNHMAVVSVTRSFLFEKLHFLFW